MEIQSYSAFSIKRVTPGFWAYEADFIPPTSAYREKTESDLLSKGADYVVIHRTETDKWYMFYELVDMAIRLYIPAFIKTQELMLSGENNVYVQMLEYIIRTEGVLANRFFVFCPTLEATKLAKMLFSSIVDRGKHRKYESKSVCAFYTEPQQEDIRWLHRTKNAESEDTRQNGVLVERLDNYPNDDQVVRILRVTAQNHHLLKKWEEKEKQCVQQKDAAAALSDIQSTENRLLIRIRQILDTDKQANPEPETEPETKKSRTGPDPIEIRFNKAFNDIVRAKCSDVLESVYRYYYIAYTTVDTDLDLIIIFRYVERTDILPGQRVKMLHIDYTVRMLQGMFRRIELGTNYKIMLPSLSNVFKSVLKFNKAEFGVDRLEIYHLTRGSTSVLLRNLSEAGRNANLDKTLSPAAEDMIYPTDYFKMDMRICSGIGCINLATHAFATDTQQVHGFCGRECAAAHFRKNKILP